MKLSRILAAACAVLLTLSLGAATPKGHLVIIGGGGMPKPIKPTILELAGGPDAGMITIGTAGGEKAQESADKAAESFRKAGFTDVTGIVPTREECNDPGYVKKILKGVNSVYFCGGVQSRITESIQGTLFHDALKKLYMNGGVISGTSAGAAIMSEIMLTGKDLKEDKESGKGKFRAITPGSVETVEGLGFLKGAIIDQHFIKRQRENRLFSIILEHPELVAIGIDEATAIVVSEGRDIEVIGKNTVMVLEPDARTIKTDANDNFGAEMKVRLLIAGDRYTIPGNE